MLTRRPRWTDGLRSRKPSGTKLRAAAETATAHDTQQAHDAAVENATKPGLDRKAMMAARAKKERDATPQDLKIAKLQDQLTTLKGRFCARQGIDPLAATEAPGRSPDGQQDAARLLVLPARQMDRLATSSRKPGRATGAESRRSFLGARDAGFPSAPPRPFRRFPGSHPAVGGLRARRSAGRSGSRCQTSHDAVVSSGGR